MVVWMCRSRRNKDVAWLCVQRSDAQDCRREIAREGRYHARPDLSLLYLSPSSSIVEIPRNKRGGVKYLKMIFGFPHTFSLTFSFIFQEIPS